MKKLLIGAIFAATIGLTPQGASAIPLAAPAALGTEAAVIDADQVHWRRYRHCHRRGYCHAGRYYRRYGWYRPYWGPRFYFGLGPWGPGFGFW